MLKVIVGMSGGVDSSVTAHLLREAGFEVEGVSFLLWEARARDNDFSGCCSLSSAASAGRTADRLGILHRSLDVRTEFIDKVIEPFADAYQRGLTPNPCILCNRYIKFPTLLKEARRRGADYIATGHYARVERNPEGLPEVMLKKGSDAGKDQSYVLYELRHDELRRLVLPLGAYLKTQVRDIARDLGLEAADRPESQEICFIENDDYCSFLEKLSPSLNLAGPILDSSGKRVGEHKGIYRYTIGQRKGLGIPSLSPHFVTRIDAGKNTVYVGSREEAKCREVCVSGINWLCNPRAAEFRATVKVRSMMKDVLALIQSDGDNARVMFDDPVWAPAPGQSAVFYDGDIVLGGGIIQPR